MSTPGKILIVDDFTDNRNAVMELLRDMSYDVRDAATAEEALTIASEFFPDIFLIDVRMPKMTGLQLLEKLEVHSHHYEAIMMTGYENINDACTAMKLGATSYLRKPVSDEELYDQVEKAMHKITLQEHNKRQLEDLKRKYDQNSQKLDKTYQIAKFQSRRFDLILESIQEPLIAIDNRYCLVIVNKAAENAFSLKCGEVLDQPVHKALPFKLPSTFYDLLATSLRHPPGTSSVCTICFNKRYWSLSISPLTAPEEDETAGFVLIFTDKTASVHATQLRDSFLGIVSHEFKSPLSVLTNTASMLDFRKHCSDEIAEAKNWIEATCEKLSYLMNTVAAFARITPDEATVRFSKTSIGQLLQKIVDTQYPDTKKNPITIISTTDDDSLEIETDTELLETAVTCLLDNAIKYSPAHSEISLRYGTNTADTLKHLIITIEDKGPGIEPDKKQLLFGWFRQGEEPLTRHHGGLGLGLPLAQRAIAILDGRINLDSGTNGGCIAEISLPIH